MRFGRYELLQRLGSGGMAEVFLARFVGPEGFEKRLVIKRVLPRLSDDRRLLRMFFEEARTHVSLSHGNLVAVFDFGRVGNEYFIAMEHVDGADLATLLGAARADGAPLSPSLVAHIGVELCRGLGYVHRRGFVHRDISPRNVLLSVDGEVKVSDFGLVAASAKGDAPSVRGTVAYTSPEQARGERVDARGDLFSLGVVLAEAVMGQRLRVASDDDEALRIARAGAPLSIDGPLAQVVARATETAPGDRYASAEEMLAALEREAIALGVGRETSVRDLATRIATLAPGTPSVSPAAATVPIGATAVTEAPAATANLRADRRSPVVSSAETYFRDHASATFVDEVLGDAPAPHVTTPAPPRPRSPVAWWAAALTTLLVGGGLTWRYAHGTAAAIPVAAPTPIVAPAATAATPAPSPAPAPAPALTAAPVAAATPQPRRMTAPHHGAERATHPPVAESGTLHIHCTPWCIPFIDDAQRGADGRNHTLQVPAGRHRVQVRRLDNHLERTVQVTPAAPETLDFKFE